MPRMEGWELCRKLGELYELPILMLTAKGETSQKLKGFQVGADDYLVKPFEPLELAPRAKAVLKRYRIATSHTVRSGDVGIDRQTFDVPIPSHRFPLPPHESNLL